MLPSNSKIWFHRQPVDFRKQIDGLMLLVADTLYKDVRAVIHLQKQEGLPVQNVVLGG
ncbi:MAG: hypothetical protein ACJAUP_002118 [Cellvibrionaceae bacterium]|jgi:hypothetical protein